ncbi:uncharacterized protein LOC106181546 [Lingula anatina]|uniref:Uncharacterized protein LOC106181546 n=1 Tax=Lingula anatina TaxID=7574 RepID=A0A1S3KGQ7_LINAN|nr:uncharacterized protein LOC106181546 [Lingula anatina]|eukprot:XP_013421416.1 uncharacterized protein LOC106181546 [Lingula anatina]
MYLMFFIIAMALVSATSACSCWIDYPPIPGKPISPYGPNGDRYCKGNYDFVIKGYVVNSKEHVKYTEFSGADDEVSFRLPAPGSYLEYDVHVHKVYKASPLFPTEQFVQIVSPVTGMSCDFELGTDVEYLLRGTISTKGDKVQLNLAGFCDYGGVFSSQDKQMKYLEDIGCQQNIIPPLNK